jgi:hypothetical protein
VNYEPERTSASKLDQHRDYAASILLPALEDSTQHALIDIRQGELPEEDKLERIRGLLDSSSVKNWFSSQLLEQVALSLVNPKYFEYSVVEVVGIVYEKQFREYALNTFTKLGHNTIIGVDSLRLDAIENGNDHSDQMMTNLRYDGQVENSRLQEGELERLVRELIDPEQADQDTETLIMTFLRFARRLPDPAIDPAKVGAADLAKMNSIRKGDQRTAPGELQHLLSRNSHIQDQGLTRFQQASLLDQILRKENADKRIQDILTDFNIGERF